jgi:hypothetical protein
VGLVDKKQEIRTFNPSLVPKWSTNATVDTYEAVDIVTGQV